MFRSEARSQDERLLPREWCGQVRVSDTELWFCHAEKSLRKKDARDPLGYNESAGGKRCNPEPGEDGDEGAVRESVTRLSQWALGMGVGWGAAGS